MGAKLYSVEELEPILGLHVKTIQRFLREGKIKGRKIGRSWMVSSENLKEYAHAELAGQESLQSRDVAYWNGRSEERIRVSAVVELHEKDSEEASRITNSMIAALSQKDPSWGPSDFRVAQYPESGTARFIFTGSPVFITAVMKMFEFIGEEN